MKKYLLSLLLILSSLVSEAQQTLQLSQYIFTPLSLNPAYAGYRDQWYINSLYRQQWVGFEGAPQDFSLTADGYINKEKTFALGGEITSDNIGLYQNLHLMASASTTIYFDKKLQDKGLSLGIGLGTQKATLLLDRLKYSDVDDPNLSFNSNNLGWQPDARLGAYLFLPRFYAGLSVLNLVGKYQGVTSGGVDVLKNIPHLYFNVGGYIPFNDHIGLKPFLVYKDDFHGISNFDVSAFLDYEHTFWFGLAYQFGVDIWKASGVNTNSAQSEMLTGIFQWFIQDRARLGYSYDFMINGLKGYQKGSHEITLGFYIKNPNSYTRLRGPRLF